MDKRNTIKWKPKEVFLKVAIDRLRGKLASLRTCRQG